jgi:hypothetical protein
MENESKQKGQAEERAGEQAAGEQAAGEAIHPFDPAGKRRCDLTVYLPVPGQSCMWKNIRIASTDDRSIEFWDERGNYQRVVLMPHVVASFDPDFDPETEGRIIRSGDRRLVRPS